MTAAAEVVALVAAGLNGLAAAIAGWLWWRADPKPWAWWPIRAGQAGALALALTAGVAAVTGYDPRDGLFWLYMLLPVAVGFVAEQLRLASAQAVLDARGLEDAQAVGRLPAEQQRSVVVHILRREMGVMAASAGVTAFLALRVLGTV